MRFVTLYYRAVIVSRIVLHISLNSWTGDNLVILEKQAPPVIAIVGRPVYASRLLLIAGRKGSSSSQSAAIKLTRQLLRS